MTKLAERSDDGWLVRTPMGYGVTRYAEVVGLLRDKRFHSAVSKLPELFGLQDHEFFKNRNESILSAEGDVHARLRRLVAPAFTPKATDRLRPFIRQTISTLLDPLTPAGRCELVAEVCEPYPIPIMCELLGAPPEDWRLFSRWAADLLRIFNATVLEDLPVIAAASVELDAYVSELIERRRREPADDLLTALIAAEEEGDRLSHQELVSLVQAVIIGGTDTTRNQLACTVALFTSYPDQWALLAERPELANRAVEESMRVLGAIRGTGRFASEDIEFNGVLFPAGTFVSASFVAANNDPAAFAGPRRFDITREGSSVQMTFGSGIHYCLGASLARAELQEALPILAQRLPGLAVDGTITWKPESNGIWGPETLPLRFCPSG
jgi:cytochrome P450